MMQLNWQERNKIWVPIFLTAFVLTIPMSSTAKSIFLVLSIAFILITPAYYQDLLKTLTKPWCQSVLLLFTLAFVGCLWSPASMHEKMLVLEKYIKLLFLPVLVVGFRESRTRQLALHAFLLAMTITCLLSIFKDLNLFSFNGVDPGRVFRNHIMTGYMMAFAAYLSALLGLRTQGVPRIGYGLFTLLFSYQVWFVNTGRTGYVIYILLMGLLFLQIFSFRQAILAALIGSSLLVVSFYHDEGLQNRIYGVVQDLNSYQQNEKDTSIGYRLQFHEFARELYNRHPLIGNGTGSFTSAFGEEKPVPSWDRRLLEPHSQYWLTAAEFGTLGLFSLAFFFLSLLWAALHLNRMRCIAIAVLLPFLAGNITDSLLFYSGTGYLFIVFMALCLGESISQPKKTIIQDKAKESPE